MYWRRFALSSIPLDNAEEFDIWLRERWTEKDALLEEYVSTGRFPPSKSLSTNGKYLNGSVSNAGEGGFVETEVKTAHWWEVGKIFSTLAMFGLVANVVGKMWNVVFYGNAAGWQPS